MAGLTEVLSAEVLPWVRDTATIGVIAGATYKALTWLQALWQQQPLIEYKLETGRNQDYKEWNANLEVFLVNRAPAPLRVQTIEVMPMCESTFRWIKGGDLAKIINWYEGGLSAYVPGAHQFPQTTMTFRFDWPDEGEEVHFRLKITSRYQLIFPWRTQFKITLPSKARPA